MLVMIVDNFRAVNESVPFKSVVEKYIGAINRSGFIRCPAHSEKTPSCKVYAHSIHCFGCGYTADAIKIVSGALDIRPLEAAKVLNNEYAIGLNLDKPDKKQVAKLLREKDRKNRERAKKLDNLKKRYNTVCVRLRTNKQSSVWDAAQHSADMVYADYLGEEITKVERDY